MWCSSSAAGANGAPKLPGTACTLGDLFLSSLLKLKECFSAHSFPIVEVGLNTFGSGGLSGAKGKVLRHLAVM